MKGFEKIKQLVADLQGDVDKATNGNKAACVRVRAKMQELKAFASEAREEALTLKKA